MNLEITSALVVLSGGQDSTTCLYKTIHHPTIERVEVLTFDYNQRHKVEIEAAKTVVEMAEEIFGRPIPHTVKEIGPIFEGGSPLTSPKEELETYHNISEMNAVIQNRIELTFVPGRNAVFGALAYAHAFVHDLAAVVMGVSQEDAANYPDCRMAFFSAFQAAMNLACDANVRFETPLMFRSKKETVELATTLPGCMEALAYSHTAYSGEYPPRTQDHATVLRAFGFEQAGVPDPLIVRAWHEGLMDLPETSNYERLRALG